MLIGFNKRHNSLFSKLIRIFTKSGWSHCFYVLDESFAEDRLITEAAFHGGVKFNLLSKYKDKNIECEFFDILNTDLEEIKKALKPYIGHKYGSLQILGNLIAKLLRLKKNPITKDLVCSEYVLRGLKGSSLKQEFEHLNEDTVSPEQLYLIMNCSSNFKKVNLWQN